MSKTVLLLLAVVLISTIAYASCQIDYICVSDCLNYETSVEYCKRMCMFCN